MDYAICPYAGWTGYENCLLAVYFFGIGNCGDVAAGLQRSGAAFWRAHFIRTVRLLYGICVSKRSDTVSVVAPPEKHAQRSVFQFYDFILGGTAEFACFWDIVGSVPGRAVIR